VIGGESSPCFVGALSEHPNTRVAVAEVVGQALDCVGRAPGAALLFVSPHHLRHLGEITSVVHDILEPRALVGASTDTVIAGSREAASGPAIGLWAASGLTGEPVRLRTLPEGEVATLTGMPPARLDGTLILLGDPFTFAADQAVHRLAETAPDLAVVGGMLSGAPGPGAGRLIHDENLFDDGAVGLLFGTDVSVTTVVSQGCRPIGEPFIVTRGHGNVIEELGGRPALERLEAMIAESDDDDRALAAKGLHAGIVIDESKAEFTQGDFLIRGVLGARTAAGAVVIGDRVEVGDTVQFHVRDAASATADLTGMLSDRRPGSGLLFTCNGRGERLFGVPDHDASLVQDTIGHVPVAGMACSGEIGPVGDRNFLHGFTASLALFDRS